MAVALVAATVVAVAEPAPALSAQDEPVGFVVLAPDRGFQGNEEARDAFAPFAAEHSARLVFVTDERTRLYLKEATAELLAAGAERLVVLPLFLSPSHPRLDLARGLIAEVAPGAEWGRSYGASYLVVEALSDRLRRAAAPIGSRLVVVASGAIDDATRRVMTEELQRLAARGASGFGFAAVTAIVAPAAGEELAGLEEALAMDLARAVGKRALVLPFDQGAELDGMMSFSAGLRRKLPEGVGFLTADLTPDPLVTLWLEREARRHLPIRPGRLGVVALAHGADFHWNQTMRQALAPLEKKFLVEPCFSMADRDLVRRAIRRLEARGADAVVVVRIFGMEGSFRDSVEGMLGLDVDGDEGGANDQHGLGHLHAGGRAQAPRIRTALPVATAGGLEDDPLFATALLDRVWELSEEPALETVLLTAHGSGDDVQNAHWQEVLASLAEQMRQAGGDRFAAIETVTWREDWPGKRRPGVARAREIVAAANAAGGRVLVIPARVTGQGQEAELLAGLDFTLGSGFAPHPLFAQWVEKQVMRGASQLPLARTLDENRGEGPPIAGDTRNPTEPSRRRQR